MMCLFMIRKFSKVHLLEILFDDVFLEKSVQIIIHLFLLIIQWKSCFGQLFVTLNEYVIYVILSC